MRLARALKSAESQPGALPPVVLLADLRVPSSRLPRRKSTPSLCCPRIERRRHRKRGRSATPGRAGRRRLGRALRSGAPRSPGRRPRTLACPHSYGRAAPRPSSSSAPHPAPIHAGYPARPVGAGPCARPLVPHDPEVGAGPCARPWSQTTQPGMQPISTDRPGFSNPRIPLRTSQPNDRLCPNRASTASKPPIFL